MQTGGIPLDQIHHYTVKEIKALAAASPKPLLPPQNNPPNIPCSQSNYIPKPKRGKKPDTWELTELAIAETFEIQALPLKHPPQELNTLNVLGT